MTPTGWFYRLLWAVWLFRQIFNISDGPWQSFMKKKNLHKTRAYLAFSTPHARQRFFPLSSSLRPLFFRQCDWTKVEEDCRKALELDSSFVKTSDILYYEVLDIPLPELQGLKTLKVAFHSSKDEITIHSIRLPKQSTVGDVINDLKTKVELSHPNAELRLLEVFNHKIYKIFPSNEKIENINDQYWTLHAEEE